MINKILIDTKEVSKDFLNLKNLNFGFANKGLTIIVGKNNTGKTKLLEYVYRESKKWDNFNDEYERDIIKTMPIFFDQWRGEGGGEFYVCSSTHPSYANKETKGHIRCYYEVYYFDLESSLLQLIEEHTKKDKGISKEIEFGKGISRGCRVRYTEDNINKFFRNLKSVVMEDEKTEEVKIVKPLILKIEDKKGDFDMDVETGVRGRSGVGISHPRSGVGSGLIKCKILQSLIKKLIDKNKTENQETDKPVEYWPTEVKIYTPILLIDEPELLLHPSLVKEIAESVKELEENKVTTILTTHSPTFLSNFIQKIDLVNLVIIQKEEKGHLRNPLHFLNFLQKPEIWEKIKSEYGQIAEKKNEDVNDSDFYINKWKRLFNKEALRVFFSTKILFVEGITDYVLFNNILREELNEELREVEIIPIFGKFHYIFFYELAKWLGLDFWFLLDEDKCKDKEGKDKWKEIYKDKKINENFWEKYGKDKIDEKKNGIMHSKKLVDDSEIFSSGSVKEAQQKAIQQISRLLQTHNFSPANLNPELWKGSLNWQEYLKKLENREKIAEFMEKIERIVNNKISWIACDLETFLGIKNDSAKDKEYNLISRADEVLTNLRENNSAKLNELKKIFTNFLKVNKK